MRIPRIHLFELEDQAWFPATIRDLATDYLHFLEARFALHRPAVPLVAEALRLSGATEIVDLCSGGTGPITGLLDALARENLFPTVTLTDRFPNQPTFARAAANSAGRISFRADSIDARAVPPELRGLRTIFNSFHHFHPRDAVTVLRGAAEAGQPIAVLEFPDRSWRTLLPMTLLTPLLVMIVTPFIRPFHWRRLLWTYLVPLVPLTSWWDGIVSNLRAYTVAELNELARSVNVEGYCWRAGQVSIGSSAGQLTYLIGYSDESAS